MLDDTQELVETFTPIIVQYSMDAIWAILILIAGWIIANWMGRRVYNMSISSGKVDATLAPILRKIVRIAVFVFTILAVLGKFGVQTASVIAVLGAATLAIGLALQGTLSNVASGVMLLIFRPFAVNDFITVGGVSGTVLEIGIFTTNMKTPDGIAIILPNGRIWGNEITNFSKNDTRRLDLSVGIGYGDDMDKALGIVKDVLANDDRVLKDPEPLVVISELGDSSVNILARPWLSRTDFWQAKWDLTKKIKEEFDKNGVSIPFPQRDVHLYQVTSERS